MVGLSDCYVECGMETSRRACTPRTSHEVFFSSPFLHALKASWQITDKFNFSLHRQITDKFEFFLYRQITSLINRSIAIEILVSRLACGSHKGNKFLCNTSFPKKKNQIAALVPHMNFFSFLYLIIILLLLHKFTYGVRSTSPKVRMPYLQDNL